MNFNSVYDIALDILDKVGGDVTKAYDSAYSVALAILDEIGGDATKNFDSVYSIMEEIYRVRFGESISGMDSVYSIAKKINEDLGDQTTGYDSTYSILVDVDENPYLIGHEFSIVTDSANTVIINGEEITSGVFPIGTTITWSVSRTGYVSQSGTYVMGDEDYSISVTLVLEQHTFTIVPTPGDATVTINGEERSSIIADYGTTITWSVDKEHYASQSGSLVLTSDVTESVSLVIDQFTFSIITDSANTVVINGEERSSLTADYGTAISWSVSREHYVTQSGSLTLTSNSTETITLVLQQFTFTINPTPADAVVTINGSVRSFLTADYGTAITWSVERTGYTSQNGTYTLTQDHTESVSLVINQYTFTIVPVPSDATVTINGEERTSITADYGTTINWSVSKTGYTTQSGTETLTETYSMEIDLSVSNFTFTIEATPVDAVVTINGEQRTSLTAAYGTAITWSVSKSHYVTQSGSYTLTGDHYETVDLVLEQHTFSISTDVANTVVINGEQRTSITADYGTTINWSVSREHYVTQSGTFTLTADDSESITLVLQQFTFSITTDSSNTVIINGSERSSITADYGTAISWSVAKSHYVTQSGSLTLTADATESVTLVLEQHTFSITTDAENTVVINGAERSSITADYGTTITWSVSRDHYVTQSNTLTLTADTTESVTLVIMTFSITVTATPNDATIYINGQERSTVTGIPYGQYTYYQVIKTGYVTQSGGFNITEDTTVNITLVLDQFTFTIEPTPADAVCVINGSQRTSLTANYGTAITWSVAKTGYVTQTGSLTLEDDTTESVSLSLEQHTFTISATPNDATVTINGQTRTTITADYGTAITWSVAKTGYVTQTGSYTLTQDHTETVTLVLEQYTFTIVPDPSDAVVVINNETRSAITADYGTAITWEVSKTGYTTQTGSYTLTQDHTENVTLTSATVTITFTKGNAAEKLVVNGEYLGTDAATHTITVDPGTEIHWEAYRAGYQTRKNDFTATSDTTVNTSLSTAKFVRGYMNTNGTVAWSIYNTAMGTYDPLTLNYDTYVGGKKYFYSTETALSNYTYQTTFQRSGSTSSCQEIKLENIGSTITADSGITGMTGYAYTPVYLSLDGCRAASYSGILGGQSNRSQYVYLNNWSPSSITNLQGALGSNDSYGRISCSMPASTNATTPKTIADYPNRMKELHMNCWESIPTPAVITNGDTSYTGSIIEIFNVSSGQTGSTGYNGNRTHIMDLMSSAEVDVYAYGWSSEDITKLKNTFKLHTYYTSSGYGLYALSGCGVIRIHINKDCYWQWRLIDEYPTYDSFSWTGNTKCYYNCTQWSFVGPVLTEPLTFDVLSDGNITWNAVDDTNAKTIEYKKNDGDWTSITSGTTPATISVVTGDVVKFRGNNSAYATDETTSKANSFGGSASVNVSGNIMSMINPTAYDYIDSVDAEALRALFKGHTGIVNADNLLLPATTLAKDCYLGLFQGCTALTSAQFTLPATTLATYCYTQMFYGCSNLVSVPALPATTLATYCYQHMFRDCTSLVNAPALPATSLAQYCYQSMFRNCTSLVIAPELPALNIPSYAYGYMFNGCTSLVIAPELPATTLNTYCYQYMFQGCTALETGAVIRFTGSLPNYSCRYMYDGCTSLNYRKLASNSVSSTSTTSPLYYWVNGVTDAATTTLVRKSGSGFVVGVSGTLTNETKVDFIVGDNYTYTVSPTPASAVVTINEKTRSTITAEDGDQIRVSVSAPGYTTWTKKFIINADATESVVLDPA